MSGCLQEAWARPQREASSSAIRADEWDGPDPAAGGPAAWGTGGRDREDQAGWIFSPRPSLHLCEGTKKSCGDNIWWSSKLFLLTADFYGSIFHTNITQSFACPKWTNG